ncbi:hypothetical protein L7F22_013741 [Adiantum nelumboides]|nr:hypothetical protein [Adiantum nelumboides]
MRSAFSREKSSKRKEGTRAGMAWNGLEEFLRTRDLCGIVPMHLQRERGYDGKKGGQGSKGRTCPTITPSTFAYSSATRQLFNGSEGACLGDYNGSDGPLGLKRLFIQIQGK